MRDDARGLSPYQQRGEQLKAALAADAPQEGEPRCPVPTCRDTTPHLHTPAVIAGLTAAGYTLDEHDGWVLRGLGPVSPSEHGEDADDAVMDAVVSWAGRQARGLERDGFKAAAAAYRRLAARLRSQETRGDLADIATALRRYGRHEAHCRIYHPFGYEVGCTCGLAAALRIASAQPPAPTQREGDGRGEYLIASDMFLNANGSIWRQIQDGNLRLKIAPGVALTVGVPAPEAQPMYQPEPQDFEVVAEVVRRGGDVEIRTPEAQLEEDDMITHSGEAIDDDED